MEEMVLHTQKIMNTFLKFNIQIKKFHKIFALVFFISGIIISVIFNFYKFTSLSSLIIYTIISVYLLAIIEIFLRKKQIKYQNNNTEVAK